MLQQRCPQCGKIHVPDPHAIFDGDGCRCARRLPKAHAMRDEVEEFAERMIGGEGAAGDEQAFRPLGDQRPVWDVCPGILQL